MRISSPNRFMARALPVPLLLLSHAIYAQPNVTGINGAVSDGQTITITGSGFGEKVPAAPLKWDDFEQGVSGTALQGWDLHSSGGINPKYSTTSPYAGRLSAYADLRSQYNSTAEYKGLNDAQEIYLSYAFRWRKLSGDSSRNVKFARVDGGYEGGYQHPVMGFTQFDNSSSSIFYHFSDAELIQTWGAGLVDKDRWHRIEYHSRLSTPGVADGAFSYVIDSVQKHARNSVMTRRSGETHGFKWLTMPYYVAHDPGGAYEYYYDNVYVDTTRARVEIGNASTWSATTKRAIQIPSAWNGTSIKVTVNQGDLDGFANSYLYVIDRDGSVNERGFPINAIRPNPPELTGVR